MLGVGGGIGFGWLIQKFFILKYDQWKTKMNKNNNFVINHQTISTSKLSSSSTTTTLKNQQQKQEEDHLFIISNKIQNLKASFLQFFVSFPFWLSVGMIFLNYGLVIFYIWLGISGSGYLTFFYLISLFHFYVVCC